MNSILNMFKVKELRSRLFFTLIVLAVYRLGCVVTIPGVDDAAIFAYVNSLGQQNRTALGN